MVAVVVEGLVAEEVLHALRIEGHPFGVEEDETLLDAIHCFLHRLAERPPLGVVGVGGPVQMRVGVRPAEPVLKAPQRVQGLRQRFGSQLSNPSPILLGKVCCVGLQ